MLHAGVMHNKVAPETEQIIKTVLYFAIFRYPLTAEEIFLHSTAEDPYTELDNLVRVGWITKMDGYYGFGITADWIEDRNRDEERFARVLKRLNRSARIISKFPFVESVALSGASSKALMKKDGDLDFFIITTPGRLWVCRTLLIAYKKLFRLNSRRYFCVNYFVSRNNLEIPDKNRFTAHEIAYLSPLYNTELFSEFLEKNAWVNQHLGNINVRKNFQVQNRNSRIKKVSEKILSGRVGTKLDRWAHRKTLKRWERKFGHFNDTDFELTLRSENDVSKHHPSNFQKKVLDRLETLTTQFEIENSCRIER